MNLRGARALVTGATGFIGAHLVRRLTAEGAQVSAFRRVDSESLRRLPSLRKVEVDWHEVDLRTYGAVANTVRAIRPDVVFHLAAEGVTDPFLSPDAAIRTNVYGMIHLLRAVDGKAPVIVARTPGERQAMNVYAVSKVAAWEFCRMYQRTHGWPIVGVMPFQVYGPGQPAQALIPSAIAAALRGEDFPMTHGEQLRDWVYVDDVVEALIEVGRRVATTPELSGETIEIGTGRTASVRAVVESIYRAVGGSGRPLIGVLPARPGEVERQAADVDRAEQLIGRPSIATPVPLSQAEASTQKEAQAIGGWHTRVSLDDGLRETITWAREWLSQPAN